MTATAPTEDFLARVAGESSPALLRYLERYVGDRGKAEDLLQETLLRVARGQASFDRRSSLKIWIFSIATHVAIDHLRQPAQRLNLVAIDEAADVAEGPPLSERLVIDEMNQCVREVIDGLPADYRAALVLYELEGMTVAETARICGCSLATAKIRIHRARRRLKEALARQCTFYRDGDDVFRCTRT